MYSKRSVEDLNANKIEKYLIDKYNTNKIIINNSSIETNDVKAKYYDKLLAFFNIFLAAALLSSFILYEQKNWANENGKISFAIILALSCISLIIYTIHNISYYTLQYKRQREYRDLNKLILIILNNVELFFYGNANIENTHHISTDTLESFILHLQKIVKYKNFKSDLFKIYKKEITWQIIFLIMFSIFLILCLGYIVKKRLFHE